MSDGLQMIKKMNKTSSFSKRLCHLVGKKNGRLIFGAFDGCLFE